MNSKLNTIGKGFFLALFFLYNPLLAQGNEDLYASTENNRIVILEPEYVNSKSNKSFEKKYHSLVSRAYFKLISEAREAERRLRIESERYYITNQKSHKTTKDVKKGADLRYKAHSEMLSGLVSWNLLSENRTGDMLYFMAENEERIFKMYRGNLSEDKMINYLIYKLADLYHL